MSNRHPQISISRAIASISGSIISDAGARVDRNPCKEFEGIEYYLPLLQWIRT
jgi:hypothetical protein